MRRVLSLAGGGIRGILPACALAALEKQTGKLTREVFDFVGGTSTGAALTAAIVAGVPAQVSLDTYLQRGREIFSPTIDILRKANLLADGCQFDNRVLYGVLYEALKSAGAERWTMNDSPIPLLITGCDVFGDTLYFVRNSGTNSGQFGRYLLLDAAKASACATTYHDPWTIPGLGPVADGGCGGVADPVYQVCREAFSGYRCFGSIDPKDAKVISLGTGYYRPATLPDAPNTLLDRIAWVTSALVGSSKTIAADSVECHWPGVLTVLNPQISSDIDEADVDSIPELLKVGQAAAAKIDWKTLLGVGAAS